MVTKIMKSPEKKLDTLHVLLLVESLVLSNAVVNICWKTLDSSHNRTKYILKEKGNLEIITLNLFH